MQPKYLTMQNVSTVQKTCKSYISYCPLPKCKLCILVIVMFMADRDTCRKKRRKTCHDQSMLNTVEKKPMHKCLIKFPRSINALVFMNDCFNFKGWVTFL